MTREEEQLLLTDLCGRLLYKPKALVNRHLSTILGIDENVVIVCIEGNDYKDEIVVSADDNSDDIKLYLRPLSSMTEEEINEFILISDTVLWLGEKKSTCILSLKQMDWLNARHFNYRGLIPAGLANKAPEGMYK